MKQATSNKQRLQEVIPAGSFEFTFSKENFDREMDKLSGIISKDYSIVFVIGDSGFGKSWFAAQLAPRLNSQPISSDDWGKVQGDKWIIDSAKVSKLGNRRYRPTIPIILVSTGDNARQVERDLITTLHVHNSDVMYIIPIPQFDLYIAIQSAKLKDRVMKDKPQVWIDHYKSRTEFTRIQYFNYFKKKFQLWFRQIQKDTPQSKTWFVFTPDLRVPGRELKAWF